MGTVVRVHSDDKKRARLTSISHSVATDSLQGIATRESQTAGATEGTTATQEPGYPYKVVPELTW